MFAASDWQMPTELPDLAVPASSRSTSRPKTIDWLRNWVPAGRSSTATFAASASLGTSGK